MNDLIAQRSREQNVPFWSTESHVRGIAQEFAHPVLDEQLESPRMKVVNVNRIRPMAADPQPALRVQRDSVRHVPRHVENELIIACGSVAVNRDATYARRIGFNDIEIFLGLIDRD